VKCTNCGKINEEDTKFCIECGAPITHESQQQSPVSQEQTATDIARETDITEAKLEDFEDTGDVSTTATLPPLSPQSGETTPAKPQSQQLRFL
jgi:RNA polymerase subunit RPABC4/transcription elongation factor Spt4